LKLSLHDPNLNFDLAKFLDFDTDCTCDFDICDQINYSIPPVSISLVGINPLLG